LPSGYAPNAFQFQVTTSESVAVLLIADPNRARLAVFPAVLVAFVAASLTMTTSVIAPFVATPAAHVHR